MPKKRKNAPRSRVARGKRPQRPRRTNPSPKPARSAPPDAAAPRPQEGRTDGTPFPVVGIGASAGGLEAYTQLLRSLPSDTGMAFVLVQHLDPTHESMLSELLSAATMMPVTQAREGIVVAPNHVYVIPPNVEMVIADSTLHLSPRSEQRGRHLPIDTFLQSLAQDQQGLAIGVILSGTASDGVVGMSAVKAAGGITFAQDETSAKYGSMPHSSIASGSVDFVLPPEGIARELERIGRHPYVRSPGVVDETLPASDGTLAKIFLLLRNASGVDFSLYKQNTIKRRLKRRMVLHRIESLDDYLVFLREHGDEIRELYEDMLVNVTGFFRDPEMFEFLQSTVYPALLGDREATFRAWVPGCSTGEEAYSLAISLFEYLGDRSSVRVQIFATDISDAAIEVARAGIYRESAVADVSPERLRRFFVKGTGGYQITKAVRDACIFARQDVTRDPPFSRLDLVSCRNVLIYLGPVLQRKVLPIFHYALKPAGYLMLGTSESIGGSTDLFHLVDKKSKAYTKRAALGRASFEFPPSPIGRADDVPKLAVPDARRGDSEIHREADRVLLGMYAPAGVLVNDRMEILQFRGRTGAFLEPAPGVASLDLTRMARDGLGLELRTALHKAKRSKGPVRREGIRYVHDGRERTVDVEILPVSASALDPTDERFYLVLFEPQGAGLPPRKKAEKSVRLSGAQEKGEVARLRRELAATKEYLQANNEEHEAINEELKSANEEILSSNEELQSTNEELETAKEELQSINEELTTVNEELQNRNQELNQVNNDLSNVFGSVNLPIVILGRDLRFRRFTQVAEKMMNLLPSDLGRRITDIKPNLEVPDLEGLIQDAIDTVRVSETTIRDTAGRWYSLRIRPYWTHDNRIDGAVMLLVDVDELNRRNQELQEYQTFTQAIADTVTEFLLVLDADLRIQRANRAFCELFQLELGEILGRPIAEVGKREFASPALLEAAAKIASGESTFIELEESVESPHGPRTFMVGLHSIHGETVPGQVLCAMVDVTERQRAETQLSELSGRLLTLRDEEQRRIARELHDSTAQNASALAMGLALVLGSADGISEGNRHVLTESRDLAEQTARELRDLASLLHPPFLDEVGLLQAVRHHVDSFQRRTGIDVNLEVPEDIDRLPKDVEMAIFRIVQESLTNVYRHSGSPSAEVALELDGDHVRVTIRDRGRGTGSGGDGRPNGRGVGIDGMRERARQLGGEMSIRSAASGTTVDVQLPTTGDRS